MTGVFAIARDGMPRRARCGSHAHPIIDGCLVAQYLNRFYATVLRFRHGVAWGDDTLESAAIARRFPARERLSIPIYSPHFGFGILKVSRIDTLKGGAVHHPLVYLRWIRNGKSRPRWGGLKVSLVARSGSRPD
ncbi:protein of unknown function [Pararobbsia alpina]